jgi:hypothetical protein
MPEVVGERLLFRLMARHTKKNSTPSTSSTTILTNALPPLILGKLPTLHHPSVLNHHIDALLFPYMMSIVVFFTKIQ